MSDSLTTANKIDGVAQNQMAWVRVTGGQDISKGPDGTVALSGWKAEDTLKTLGDWAKTDGLDTRNATPNFRNSVHGSLNHHVSDHTLGSWSEKSVVVVAPLNKVMEANAAPAALNTVDTYWTLASNKSLQLPGATVIRPDESGALKPSETSKRVDASNVVYAVSFNDDREKQLLGQLSSHDRSMLAQRINTRTGGSGTGEDGTLAVPRADRPASVSAVVDGELAQLAKRSATNNAVAEIGPVRQGNNYAWQGAAVQDDTARLAKALGTKPDAHTGSSEDKAVDLMRAGRAAEVSALPGVAKQTQDLASVLTTDSRYQAFAQAKAVDRELGEAATSTTNVLSTPARERLVTMVERSAEGLSSPPIQVVDRFGKLSGQSYSVTSSDSPAAKAMPEAKVDEAVKQNARLSTLVRTALKDETDPSMTTRLSSALSQLSSSNAALTSKSNSAQEAAAPTGSQTAKASAEPVASKPAAAASYWSSVAAKAPAPAENPAVASQEASKPSKAMRA